MKIASEKVFKKCGKKIIKKFFPVKKKLVFTSHSSETERYSEYIFKFVWDKGAIPIDGYLALPTYMLTWTCCNGDRKRTLETSINLLLRCDEMWVFGPTKDPNNCEKHGVQQEIFVWKKYKNPKKIKYFTWREVGVPKYTPGSKWTYDFTIKKIK
jgi:hypothetical protein